MTYQLWETTSRNLAAVYDTEGAALATIREAIATNGRDYAARFALIAEDRRGRTQTLAMGITLVDRALVGVPTAAGADR
jgi:hypothetical protein